MSHSVLPEVGSSRDDVGRRSFQPVGTLSGWEPEVAPDATAKVRGPDRWLARQLLQRTAVARLRFVLWNGEELSLSEEAPIARLHLQDRAILYHLVFAPDIAFGDGYRDGRILVEGDLLELLLALFRAQQQSRARRVKPLGKWRRRNTLAGSRENIHHHYDIGNDFYRLWLDEQLLYTCAYFPDPNMSLEAAQIAKMDHVCRKLRLQPGEVVVEAGCGWGRLALHMARHYHVKVRAYNISREQIADARRAARAEGLQDHVEFVHDDYRNINGRYDVFVSVGMLEHVGCDHYPTLSAVIDRCLTPDGRGLIHSIGRNRPMLFSPWIERRVFPGAYPPALREMMEIFEPSGLSVLDVENLRLHYALTLRHWLARFETSAAKVAEMFDEKFVRAWCLYLTGSVAAFEVGALQLFQVLFARPTLNELPWSRAHLYEQPIAADG